MEWVKEYSNPEYTAAFQKACGIVAYGPGNSPTVVTDNNNTQNGYADRERVNGVINGYRCHQRRTSVPEYDCDDSKQHTEIPNGLHKDTDNGVHGTGIRTEHDKKKLSQSSDVLDYAITNRFLYYLFRFGALMGNEEFFLTFFPFFVWNVDSTMGRQVIIVWVTVMYLGQVTKDIMQWPRPLSPPVVRLETEHSQESGMPSTHAMAATAISFTLFALVFCRYEISIWICIVLPVIWTAVVCLSRLYLGVHSVSDVVGGVLFSLGIMVAFIPCLQKFDVYQQSHPFSPFVVVVLAIALCTVCYPEPKEGHNAKSNCTQIMGSTCGESVAVWMNYQLGFTKALTQRGLYSLPSFTWSWAWLSSLRFVTGMAAIVLTYVAMRLLSIRAFSYLFGLEKPDKKHPSVMVAYKFWTYFTLGFTILFFIPLAHSYFGIARDAFYYEFS